MEKWFKICLLLCLFGVLKEFRPSEPFLTEYLVGPWKNLTSDQVIQWCVMCLLLCNCCYITGVLRNISSMDILVLSSFGCGLSGNRLPFIQTSHSF